MGVPGYRVRELFFRIADHANTQREIAEELGVSQKTVSNTLVKNGVRTQKTTNTEKRQIIRYEISSYTKPETAAAKLREKFGDEWLGRLGDAIEEGKR